MREKHFYGLGPQGFHRVAYTEWGDADNPKVLVCVHGLTRNGRDFDELAKALSDEWRVICPDMPGRGASDWLADPKNYDFPLYLNDMTALIARSGAEQVDWVGTSMGGLIGLFLAAQPKSPIRKMVMNDVGPFVSKQGLGRIRQLVGANPLFATFDEALMFMGWAFAPFGVTREDHLRALTEHSLRPAEEGGFRLHFDPKLAESLSADEPQDVNLWSFWSLVTCPVLVVHGETSDILTRETVDAMQGCGPGCEVFTVANVGHAPMLMDEAQIHAVRDWLKR